MRIETPWREAGPHGPRIVADVVWESADRPPDRLYFETDGGGSAPELSVAPFVVATFPLAGWLGESRVIARGSLCPRLADGLAAATERFAGWWDRCRPVELLPTEGLRAPEAPEWPRTASFLTGGVDSLALLRENLRHFPDGHPGRVREAVVVFGLNRFEFEDGRPSAARVAAFEGYTRSLEELGAECGVGLARLYTNARVLYPGFRSWWEVGFGACLAACAVALAPRYASVLVASDGDGVDPYPSAGHPSLYGDFSTATLRLITCQLTRTRLQKMRDVAGWPAGLRVLRTCLEQELHPDGLPNCGRCQKCLRTMVALEAVGGLDRAPTYPSDRLDGAAMRSLKIASPWERGFLIECVEPLCSAGRGDLADALRSLIASYDRRARAERSVAGRVARRLRAMGSRLRGRDRDRD